MASRFHRPDTSSPPAEKPPARDLALRRLSVREYSMGEMASYLKRKGYPKDEAEQVARELREEGLIDDRRFARVIARDQAMRDKGPMRVLQKLRSKGVKLDLREVRRIMDEGSVSSGLVPTADGDQGYDELASARRVVDRRYPNAAADPNQRRKAYLALLRRGFSRDVARQAISGPIPQLDDESSDDDFG